MPRFSDHDFAAFVLYAHRELELDVSELNVRRDGTWECRCGQIDGLRDANVRMLLRETTPDVDAGWERDPNWSPRPTDRNRRRGDDFV